MIFLQKHLSIFDHNPEILDNHIQEQDICEDFEIHEVYHCVVDMCIQDYIYKLPNLVTPSNVFLILFLHQAGIYAKMHLK